MMSMYLIFSKILNSVIMVINCKLIVLSVMIWFVREGFKIICINIVNIDKIIIIKVVIINILKGIIFCLFF